MERGEVRGLGVDGDANGTVVHVLPAMRGVNEGIIDKNKEALWPHLSTLWDTAGQVLKGGDTALITDCLPAPVEEACQPRYQVGIKTQTNGLGDNNSVVHKIKGFSKVYKSNSKRGVTFFQVAVYKIKEADKAVSGGRGFHISKLL